MREKRGIAALSLVLLVAAGAVFAEDGLAVTGNLNTGLVIDKPDGQDATAHLEREGTPGRVRTNFKLTKDNVVVEWSLQLNQLDAVRVGPNASASNDFFPEAKGTATFLNGQFDLSIGRLGGQWGSGGPADVSTGDSMAHFTFKPAAVPGLSAGFSLVGVTASTYSVAEYFSEFGFGVKYAPENVVDIRVGAKLDSEGDGVKSGTKVFFGISPTVISTFVPGLSVWADGGFTGLGVEDGNTTKLGFKVAYDQNGFAASVPVTYELFAKSTWTAATPKTGLYVKPGTSYKITPWLKPGVDVEVYFYTFDGGNLEALDNVIVAPYVTFDTGSGLTVTPYFKLDLKGENGKTTGANGDSLTNVRFELRLDYSF